MYFSSDYKTLHLKKNFPKDKPFNPVVESIALNAFEVEKDLNLIEEVAHQMTDSDVQIEEVLNVDEVVQTEYGRKIVKRLIFVERTRTNVIKQKELGSTYRNTLISRAENSEYVKTPTVAIEDKEIKNGDENVIEKFSVYNDTPAAMLTKLNAFTVFNECSSNAQQPNSETPTETTDEMQPAVAQNNDENSDNANPPTPLEEETQNNNNEFQSIDQSAAQLINEANVLEGNSELGCVKFIADDFGIVASGSILDIQLAEKFLVDQDQPVKQAMIETFILEVKFRLEK